MEVGVDLDQVLDQLDLWGKGDWRGDVLTTTTSNLLMRTGITSKVRSEVAGNFYIKGLFAPWVTLFSAPYIQSSKTNI